MKDRNIIKKTWSFLVMLLASVGLYTILNIPSVNSFITKLWDTVTSSKFYTENSSFNTKIKGMGQDNLFNNQTRKKITSKKQGLWIVSTKTSKEVDTSNMDDVIFSAKSKDTIRINPGTYTIFNLDINRPLNFIGQGNSPEEVILIIKSKSNIEFKKTDTAKVTFTNLTIKSSHKTYQGPFISVLNGDLILQNIDLLISNQESAIALFNNSYLDADSSFFSTSDRSTAIHLFDSSSSILSNCILKNNKTAIYGNIDNFSGNIHIAQSKILNSRSAGIALYGGKLKIEDSFIQNNIVGISLRNSATGNIVNTHIQSNELNGIDITNSSKARIDKCKISNNNNGIRLNNNSTIDQLTNSTIYENKTGVKILKNSQIKINNSTFNKNNNAIYFNNSTGELSKINCTINKKCLLLEKKSVTIVDNINYSNNFKNKTIDRTSKLIKQLNHQ